MRKFFTLLVMSALFGTSAMAQAVIKFEKTIHDFGQFDKNKIQTYEFVFVNSGDKPLVIHQAYGSCGCTVPQFSKDPIEPGKKGVIKVSKKGGNAAKMRFFSHRCIGMFQTNHTNSLYLLHKEYAAPIVWIGTFRLSKSKAFLTSRLRALSRRLRRRELCETF